MAYSNLDEQGQDATKTPRLTRPNIVFGSTTCLAVSSIITFAAAISVCLTNDMTSGISACQGLLVFTALLTFLYVGLYLFAARRNDDVGRERPPTQRLHAMIFILLRLGILLWFLGIVASSVVVSKNSTYTKRTMIVNLQKLDLALSIISLVTSTTILHFLETCQYPFETPECLHIRPKVVCRVSSFGEDILSRSISRAGSFSSYECEKKSQDLEIEHQSPLQIHTAKLVRLDSVLKMPVAFPRTALSHSSSHSSSEWTSISGSSASSDSGRKITPSSSISNMSRRSPLSTMRYVDYPDIAIRPELRYIPPQYPSVYDMNLPLLRHPAPLSGPSQWDLTAPVLPLPVANPDTMQHSPSFMMPTLMIRRVGSYESIRSSRSSSSGGAKTSVGRVPPPPPEAKKVRIIRRKTVDVKVPGGYPDPYAEQVEEHSKKIFAEIASEKQRNLDTMGIRSLKKKTSAMQLRRKASWDV